MILKDKISEIIDSNNFGNIEIKYGKKENYSISYYTSLVFGDIPDRILKKEVLNCDTTGQSGRVDYCLSVR